MNAVFVTYFHAGHDGSTTYISEISSALSSGSALKVYVATLGCPSAEVCIKDKDNVTHIGIPFVSQDTWMVSICLLSTIIEDDTDTIFLLNFTPSYRIASYIKSVFTQSKFVHVIHDFIWATYVNGDIGRFMDIIQSGKNITSPINFKEIFQDGIKTFAIADAVVCLSEDTQKLLQDFYKVQEDKIHLIKNGLSDNCRQADLGQQQELRKRYRIGGDATVFLFVGRLTEQKGINLLLDAMNLLDCNALNCTLVCIGEVRQEAMLKFMKNANRDRIIFTGALNEEDVYVFYQLAKFGIILSQYEQCSYVGIEMKMFSLPVIASQNYGVKNMFTPMSSINVENNPSAVAQAIKKLVWATDTKSMCTASRRDYINNYTAKTMCEKYNILFQHVIR